LTISGLIGTYQYDGLNKFPAISIGEPDSDVTVEGIEIIISKFPSVQKACRAGNLMYRDEVHSVCVFLHPTSNEDEYIGYEKFYDVVDFIFRSFPRITGNNVQLGKQYDSLPQYQMYITVTNWNETRDLRSEEIPFGGTSHYNNHNHVQ